MSKESPWILLDGQWLGHRAMHATGALAEEDIRTGVVYGFFEALRATCSDSRLQSNRVAIAFDSRYSIRQDAHPFYKRKRHEDRTPEQIAEIKIMHKQLRLLRREVLPEIGFPVLVQRGLESDDMIAQAAMQLTLADCFKGTLGKTAVMVTSDYDLLQCVTMTIHWFDSARNLYLDLDGVREKKGVLPCTYAVVKALSGCPTDGVPGIKGVGEKTAVKYLKQTLKESHLTYKRIVSDDGQAIKMRNLELVQLPHKATKPIVFSKPIYDFKAFLRWSKRLGFRSFVSGKRREGWEKFFAGEFR